MISSSDFDKVCRLAKLSISEADKDRFLDKLNSIFNWIDQIQKIDTSSVEEIRTYNDVSTPERTDTPCLSNTRQEVLSNTKNKKFDMFCVPKIVE